MLTVDEARKWPLPTPQVTTSNPYPQLTSRLSKGTVTRPQASDRIVFGLLKETGCCCRCATGPQLRFVPVLLKVCRRPATSPCPALLVQKCLPSFDAVVCSSLRPLVSCGAITQPCIHTSAAELLVALHGSGTASSEETAREVVLGSADDGYSVAFDPLVRLPTCV
jgi:hypothetical protein